MSSFFALLFMLAMLALPVMGILFVIRWIRKKPKKKLGVAMLVTVALAVLSMVISMATMGCTHEWQEATCTAPKSCSKCDATEGEPLGHEWQDATCTKPKTCYKCGETEGEPLGHEWQEATDVEPKTCTRCSETVGEPRAEEDSSTYDIGSSSSASHYCEECSAPADYLCENFISGDDEYYCEKHYQEIMDILDMMESDVGTSSASNQQCEECSREGTHSIIGISGQTEYYCTEHYNELQELMELLGLN